MRLFACFVPLLAVASCLGAEDTPTQNDGGATDGGSESSVGEGGDQDGSAGDGSVADSFLWKYVLDAPSSSNVRISFDDYGNLYFATALVETNPFSIGSQACSTNWCTVVGKIDATGKAQWVNVFDVHTGDLPNQLDLVAMPGGAVWVSGIFRDTAKWDTHTLTANFSSGNTYDFYLVQLDAAGAVTSAVVMNDNLGGVAGSTSVGADPQQIRLARNGGALIMAVGLTDTIPYTPTAIRIGVAGQQSVAVLDLDPGNGAITSADTIEASATTWLAPGGLAVSSTGEVAVAVNVNSSSTAAVNDSDTSSATNFSVAPSSTQHRWLLVVDYTKPAVLESLGWFVASDEASTTDHALYATSIAFDSFENVVVAGGVQGTGAVIAGTTVDAPSAGNTGAFVVEISKTAKTTTWSASVGSEGPDFPAVAVVGPSDAVTASTVFSAKIDGFPGAGVATKTNMYTSFLTMTSAGTPGKAHAINTANVYDNEVATVADHSAFRFVHAIALHAKSGAVAIAGSAKFAAPIDFGDGKLTGTPNGTSDGIYIVARMP